MRKTEEVYHRIKWDEKYNKDECVIGYEDRFVGIMDSPFDRFDKDLSSDTFVPWHRVQYFKVKGEIVWDRRTRVDLIFGATESNDNSASDDSAEDQ